MANFRFSTPVEIRYADLDPQGHVNHAAFLTYFEQARIKYVTQLRLLNKDHLLPDVGVVLADARVTFLMPVLFEMDLRVGARIARVGRKSMMMEYELINEPTQAQLATGTTVLVAFDYSKRHSIFIPDAWREKISTFEGL